MFGERPVRVVFSILWPVGGQTYSELVEEIRNEGTDLDSYCSTYGYALVTVVTPNPSKADPDYLRNYAPLMVRWVMFSYASDKPEYELYKRPDLEYVKIIENFMNYLSKSGYTPYTKVFVTGFSAGGGMANRFPILHPDKVAATAIGGVGAYLYPVETWDGATLTYPVGTSDINQIPGNTYSLNAFKQIPHFIFHGEDDILAQKDPVRSGCYDQDQADIINEYFGANQVKRVHHYSNYLKSIGMQCTEKIYSGVGHEWTNQMIVDTFGFFESVSTG